MTAAIAVALYNGERFLRGQLDSLRLQSCPADQVVLCDDCSKDNTFSLVESYIREYGLEGRWHLDKNEPNLGYVKNFYKAVSLCSADLVFLCDQDDIWEADKLEKMTAVMEQRDEICLLACQYGIIDAEGNRQHSVVESNEHTDGAILPVSVMDIMRAYRWPGMIMCLRKSFFDDIYDQICTCSAAHDLVFCMCAAERGGFYDYHYVGAYHRRHGNNAAREEHRITKLLNRDLKLREIDVTLRLWDALLASDIHFADVTRVGIEQRRSLLQERKEALQERSIFKVFRLYTGKSSSYLRLKSLVCDLWLVCFS